MVAFSRDAAGRLHSYAPGRATDPPVPLEPNVRDRALDHSTRLGVNHAAGAYFVEIRIQRGEVAVAELRATLVLEAAP